MYRRREHVTDEDQFSISPFFSSSKKCKEISPTWNLKIFEIEKKSLALNEATKILGSIVGQINSLGKPAGQLPFNLQSHSNLLNNGPEPPRVLGKEDSKGPEKGKEIEIKTKKNEKKNTEAFSSRVFSKDDDEIEKFKEKNLLKNQKKNKKNPEGKSKVNGNSDIAEMLYGNLKDLYRRVNKKNEEVKKLGETTSLLSLQTRQKIESLESKVAKIKLDLISPGYKSTQILKDSLIKPKRESIFPKIYK
jgi:hypothetical protein